MASTNIQRRQEAERRRVGTLEAVLRQVSSRPRPTPDFERALREASEGFAGEAIRDGAAWRPQIKTRDAARLRLAAARHLYARYAVPSCLEHVWIDSDGLDGPEILLRKRWYVAAAGGASLYKAGAGEWLSRREVHVMLATPDALDFDAAMWWAIARGMTDDAATVLRLARSRIARQGRGDMGFWRDVARFFCANPATLEEVDDLCDFLADRRGRDPGYSLKGRTLSSLARQMADWHQDLALIRRADAAAQLATRTNGIEEHWRGSALHDWSWQLPEKEAGKAGEVYVITQLCSSAELVEETRAMHHCVWTYAGKCAAGHASIWSMKRRWPGRSERLLTIELDRQHRAMQVRGFANRLATQDERKVLARWAKARGVLLG